MTDEEITVLTAERDALKAENTDLKARVALLTADLATVSVARDTYKKGFETQSALRRADLEKRKAVVTSPVEEPVVTAPV